MPENKIRMRIPTTEEWDHMMDITHENNDITHWKNMFSWVHDEVFEKQNLLCRSVRGYYSARSWGSLNATSQGVNVGFRPAIEGLTPDALTPNERGTTIIGTLFVDGKPVKVPQSPFWDGNISEYVPGAKLTIGPALNDPAYQINGIVLGNGIAIADRILLNEISYEDVEKALSYEMDKPIYYPCQDQPTMKAAIKNNDAIFFTTTTTAKTSVREDGTLTTGVLKGIVLGCNDDGFLIISNGTPKWYHEDDIVLYTPFTPKHPDADAESVPPLKKLWMRAGVSLFLTDEEIERLLTADDEDLTDAIVEGTLKDGRWQFDGNSYIPQQVVEEFVRKHGLPYDTDQEPECELDPRHFCPAKTTR